MVAWRGAQPGQARGSASGLLQSARARLDSACLCVVGSMAYAHSAVHCLLSAQWIADVHVACASSCVVFSAPCSVPSPPPTHTHARSAAAHTPHRPHSVRLTAAHIGALASASSQLGGAFGRTLCVQLGITAAARRPLYCMTFVCIVNVMCAEVRRTTHKVAVMRVGEIGSRF